MDYARREFLLTLRRVVAAGLALTLLVAFWADRPAAAASHPKGADGVAEEPRLTAGISLLRRPWLTFYTIMGAPALNHGALSEEEESEFRRVVGSLAGIFFLIAALLMHRGQRHIDAARKAS